MDAVGIPGYRQRLAAHPVACALAVSLAMHLLFFGAMELSERLHLQFPEWLKAVLNLSKQLAEEKKNPPANDREPPTLTFVEVDPSQVAAEPPQDTRNYSSFNSLASNPETAIESTQPKLDGSQNKVPKVMDTLRPAPAPPLTPMKPEPEPVNPKPEIKPAEKPGELAFAKPADTKPKEAEKPNRPRTLIEAQLQKGMIPGRKLQQEGGVKRHGTIASLDARVTPYAAYDEAIIRAVSKRWYDILDATTTPTRPGQVVLEFRLHYDGRVSELRVLESEVGDVLALYCQKAISDPSPYAPWPKEMRRMLAKDSRLITFTFYYEF
jgi:outer membrane biosynthesis protein TonB